MEWETLPLWFWALYYVFLLLTLVTAIVSAVKNRHRKLALLAAVFAVITPLLGINSTARPERTNEAEFLLIQLQEAEIWAVVCAAGYLLILWFWICTCYPRG